MNATSSKLRMPHLRLLTSRLELVAATVELAKAEINNLPLLAQLLDTPTPTNWPPPLNERCGLEFMVLYPEGGSRVSRQRGV